MGWLILDIICMWWVHIYLLMVVVVITILESEVRHMFIHLQCLQYVHIYVYLVSVHVYTVHCASKATTHQVTTMLATSKNILFPGHNTTS